MSIPTSLVVKVHVEQGFRAACERERSITIPTELKVAGTYLIFSEVSYRYVPAVG